MFQTCIGNGEADGFLSAGVAAGGKIGLTGTWMSIDTGYSLLQREVSFGAGLPAGPLPFNGAAGASNTFIRKQMKIKFIIVGVLFFIGFGLFQQKW